MFAFERVVKMPVVFIDKDGSGSSSTPGRTPRYTSSMRETTKTLKLNLFSLPESAGYASRPIHTEGTSGQPVQAAGQSYGNYIAAKET